MMLTSRALGKPVVQVAVVSVAVIMMAISWAIVRRMVKIIIGRLIVLIMSISMRALQLVIQIILTLALVLMVIRGLLVALPSTIPMRGFRHHKLWPQVQAV